MTEKDFLFVYIPNVQLKGKSGTFTSLSTPGLTMSKPPYKNPFYASSRYQNRVSRFVKQENQVGLIHNGAEVHFFFVVVLNAGCTYFTHDFNIFF